MAKSKKFNGFVIFILVILASVIGASLGAYAEIALNVPKGDVYYGGGLEIHFPELGSYYTGDCTLIKVGSTEVLIDAGAKTANVDVLDKYISTYCEDGMLEYVIVTHAHEDHYAGFSTENSLFNRYKIGTIIEFAQITDGKANQVMYKNYVRERDEAKRDGATCYTAAECRTSGNYVFDLGKGAMLTVLDSKYYYEAAKSENEHSVCTLVTKGDSNFLFTGDLEKKGEESLVELNDLPEVDLFKAGHHGSKTSSNDCLLSVIKPKVVCVCCCAGSAEYTSDEANKFPTQDFIDRVSKYTDKVYVTTMFVDDKEKTYKSMNGNIVVKLTSKGVVVSCSASDTILKDTDWFKNNRTLPSAWQ